MNDFDFQQFTGEVCADLEAITAKVADRLAAEEEQVLRDRVLEILARAHTSIENADTDPVERLPTLARWLATEHHRPHRIWTQRDGAAVQIAELDSPILADDLARTLTHLYGDSNVRVESPDRPDLEPDRTGERHA